MVTPPGVMLLHDTSDECRSTMSLGPLCGWLRRPRGAHLNRLRTRPRTLRKLKGVGIAGLRVAAVRRTDRRAPYSGAHSSEDSAVVHRRRRIGGAARERASRGVNGAGPCHGAGANNRGCRTSAKCSDACGCRAPHHGGCIGCTVCSGGSSARPAGTRRHQRELGHHARHIHRRWASSGCRAGALKHRAAVRGTLRRVREEQLVRFSGDGRSLHRS